MIVIIRKLRTKKIYTFYIIYSKSIFILMCLPKYRPKNDFTDKNYMNKFLLPQNEVTKNCFKVLTDV